MSIEDYKIFPYVDEFFSDRPYYAVDFKRHLLPTVSLSKKIYRTSGRPDYIEYYHAGILMAKRYFTFIDDPNSGMVVYRKEDLCYIKNDDSEGDKFQIKIWQFNPADYQPDDTVYMAEERAQSRGFIISELKIIVYSAMQAVYPGEDSQQLGTRAGEFFNYHAAAISGFIQAGDKSLSTTMAQDMEPDHVPFLDASSGAPGVTVRQSIIAKVNF